MDNELALYIVTYFTKYLTDKEKLCLKHLQNTYTLQNSEYTDLAQREILYKRIGWISEDKEILDFVSGGDKDVNKKIAKRILLDHSHEIFINNCSKCGKLARTPFAKQCRHCGNIWR